MKQTLIAFVFIILTASNAYPHFCVKKNLHDDYQSSAEVFAGEVIDVTPDPNFRPEPILSVHVNISHSETRKRFVVRFKVLEDFKSAFSYKKEMTLYVYGGTDWLQTEFRQGEKYLVFASKTDNGLITGGLCSGTRRLDDASQLELKQLRNGWFWIYRR